MPNIPKLVFFISAAVIFGGLIFGLGLYSGYERNAIFHFVKGIQNNVKLVFREAGNLTSTGDPTNFLQPARHPGVGVTVNERADDGKLILLTGHFGNGNEIRLIRRDGTVVARWPVSFSDHFPDTSHLETPPATDRNVDVTSALINTDGSIVFNFEYAGMVKLSRCGETVWTLAHPTHHSIELAEGGGYWVPGRRFLRESDGEGFPPFTRQGTNKSYPEDLILKVDQGGTIIEQVSVPWVLYDNGLEPLMTATGHSFRTYRADEVNAAANIPDWPWERELVHLNKIRELSSSVASAFPAFNSGDLVLSLRNYNLIFVVEPGNWRVKWHQTGPWRRQHDPEFNDDGTISVFNNNVYVLELAPGYRAKLTTPRISNIVKVDPSTRRSEVIYGERDGQELLTVVRGDHDPTPEGGFLITEFEAGRVFEIDAQNHVVWEYINRYDTDRVLEVTKARLYPTSYFNVSDWACSGGVVGN